ncbi:uncharacterized protein [Panulirus ornatus]|uniref:uncharacterized protein isoform X3 n=1 Tax=Panulirus ornatus TaxID=150431 RepID=UPI003A848024
MLPRLSLGSYKRGSPWRVVWAAGVGGVLTMSLLNLALCTPLLLSLYCESECTVMSWRSPVLPENKITISHIREHVLGPAQRQVAQPITQAELDEPPWINLGAWSFVESAVRIIFKHKRGGVFVEVGAGPGVFKSHTAWLEARRGWSGLLIEPRSQAYAQLRRRRKAAAAKACASDFGYSKKDELWSPNGSARLTQHYRDIALARSTLMAYVDDQVMVVRYSTKIDRTFIIDSAKRFDLVHQPSDQLDADRLLFFIKKVSNPKASEKTGNN